MDSQRLAVYAASASPSVHRRGTVSIERERRTVGQALSWWHDLRGDRRLPLLGDVDLFYPTLAPTLFLLDLDDGPDAAVFRHCGGGLSGAFGRRLTGRRMVDALPPDMAEHLLNLMLAVWRYRRPLADAASQPRVRGGGVLRHRMAVMPVSDDTDGLRVSHILGAFSYRIDFGS